MLKMRDSMGQDLHNAFNDILNDFTSMHPHAQVDAFFSEYLVSFFPEKQRVVEAPPPPQF